VEFAQAGVTGSAAPFEGRYGLLFSYTDNGQPAELTAGLGDTWLLLQTAVKPYPSCRWTHGAIDAALSLRTRVSDDDRYAARITVRLNPTAYSIVGEPQPHKVKPANTVDAQFSVYFQVAAAWLDGHVDWSTYDHLSDRAITAMAARVDVEKDDHVARTGAVIDVVVGSRILCKTIDVPLGEPTNWISDDLLRTKFERHACRIYGNRDAQTIAATVLDGPLSMPVGDVTRQLRPSRDRQVG